MTIQDSPVVAGKIVPKSLLVKQHQREKMAQEISLHKTLNHPYIVKLYSYFEDKVSSTKEIVISAKKDYRKGNKRSFEIIFSTVTGFCIHHFGIMSSPQSDGIT